MTPAEVIDRLAAENLAQRQAVEELARTVRCRSCGMAVGAPCRTRRKRATRSHAARVVDSREKASA